jgi:hypothetical protein
VQIEGADYIIQEHMGDWPLYDRADPYPGIPQDRSVGIFPDRISETHNSWTEPSFELA